MNRRLLTVCLAALATGCAARHIPGTDIEDTKDTRAILKVFEAYRQAMEAKDADRVVSLVADSFKDDGGNANPSDDLDFARLKKRLPEQFALVNDLRLDVTVRRIDVNRYDRSARVVYTYTSTYKAPTISQRPYSDSEIKEMMFRRVGDDWKITSGI